MHKLLDTKAKIWLIFFSMALPYLVLALAYERIRGTEFGGVGSWFVVGSWTVMVVGLVASILSSERVCSVVVRDGFLKRCGVPAFRGRYSGELRSNYSRLDALRNAARSAELPRLDADQPNFVDSIELLSARADLEVRASLWRVRVLLTTFPAQDGHPGIVSRSSVSSLERARDEDQAIVISYLYSAVNKGQPRGNDQQQHQGAACLTVRQSGEAIGLYWTARNWQKGMNTAGEMRFLKGA